jgi:CTP-dependent riboflavin kinase
MLQIEGQLVDGIGDFRKRMTRFPDVFAAATGERLFPGTLNVRVASPIPAVEHFRIKGSEIGEPEQDLLFEVCRVNDVWAYRIRPLNLLTGAGGHGDHILEMASSVELRPVLAGKPIVLGFFR